MSALLWVLVTLGLAAFTPFAFFGVLAIRDRLRARSLRRLADRLAAGAVDLDAKLRALIESGAGK